MSGDKICEKDAVINDVETCRDAVSHIKKLIPNARFAGIASSSNRPKGCYLHQLGGTISFNEHHAGNNNPNARPICQIQGIN